MKKELKTMLAEYYTHKTAMDGLKSEMDALRDPLIETITSVGEPTGGKSYTAVAGGIEGTVTVLRATKLTESAETVLRKAGVWNDVCDQVPNINKIDELFASGRIDAKLLSKVLAYGEPSYRLAVRKAK